MQLQCRFIVKLLHYYETPNHRIFLLLDYLGRGTLLDYVVSKREQWRKLKESATNPPPSSSLFSTKESSGDLPLERGAKEEDLSMPGSERLKDRKAKKEVGKDQHHGSDLEEAKETGEEAEGKETGGKDGDQLMTSDGSMDSEMEKMLTELSGIVPPSNLPPSDSSFPSPRINISISDGSSNQNNEEKESEDEDSLDMLALMRRRLEESMQEAQETQHKPDSGGKDLRIELDHSDNDIPRGGSEGKVEEEEDFEVINTTIQVLPPTPTITKANLGNGKLEITSFPLNPMKSLKVGSTEDVAVSHGGGGLDLPSSSTSSSGAMPIPGAEKVGLGRDGGEQAPFFTPSSLQSSDLKRVCLFYCLHALLVHAREHVCFSSSRVIISNVYHNPQGTDGRAMRYLIQVIVCWVIPMNWSLAFLYLLNHAHNSICITAKLTQCSQPR